LGNQLFTYFAAAEYSIRHGKKLILITSELPFGISDRQFGLIDFDLPVPFECTSPKSSKNYNLPKTFVRLRRLLFRFLRPFVYESNVVGFDAKLETLDSVWFLKGYFQSWRYFDLIQKQFPTTKVMLLQESSQYQAALDRLKAADPICIHVRRGDYNKLATTFGLLDEDYFLRAISKAGEIANSREIWLFSDEPLKVRLEFENIVFNLCPSEEYDLNDSENLLLMASSNTLIISNSSYSWWAGTLGNQNKKVIYPTPWHRSMPSPVDLCPPGWYPLSSSWKQVQNA
jgi:hypothetical protein